MQFKSYRNRYLDAKKYCSKIFNRDRLMTRNEFDEIVKTVNMEKILCYFQFEICNSVYEIAKPSVEDFIGIFYECYVATTFIDLCEDPNEIFICPGDSTTRHVNVFNTCLKTSDNIYQCEFSFDTEMPFNETFIHKKRAKFISFKLSRNEIIYAVHRGKYGIMLLFKQFIRNIMPHLPKNQNINITLFDCSCRGITESVIRSLIDMYNELIVCRRFSSNYDNIIKTYCDLIREKTIMLRKYNFEKYIESPNEYNKELLNLMYMMSCIETKKVYITSKIDLNDTCEFEDDYIELDNYVSTAEYIKCRIMDYAEINYCNGTEVIVNRTYSKKNPNIFTFLVYCYLNGIDLTYSVDYIDESKILGNLIEIKYFDQQVKTICGSLIEDTNDDKTIITIEQEFDKNIIDRMSIKYHDIISLKIKKHKNRLLKEMSYIRKINKLKDIRSAEIEKLNSTILKYTNFDNTINKKRISQNKRKLIIEKCKQKLVQLESSNKLPKSMIVNTENNKKYICACYNSIDISVYDRYNECGYICDRNGIEIYGYEIKSIEFVY